MSNDMEIEDYFMRKLKESAISNNGFLPLPSIYLKGNILVGRQSAIACNKFPAGIGQFTEIKVIHGGSVERKK
jgi:hypothetical protein